MGNYWIYEVLDDVAFFAAANGLDDLALDINSVKQTYLKAILDKLDPTIQDSSNSIPERPLDPVKQHASEVVHLASLSVSAKNHSDRIR